MAANAEGKMVVGALGGGSPPRSGEKRRLQQKGAVSSGSSDGLKRLRSTEVSSGGGESQYAALQRSSRGGSGCGFASKSQLSQVQLASESQSQSKAPSPSQLQSESNFQSQLQPQTCQHSPENASQTSKLQKSDSDVETQARDNDTVSQMELATLEESECDSKLALKVRSEAAAILEEMRCKAEEIENAATAAESTVKHVDSFMHRITTIESTDLDIKEVETLKQLFEKGCKIDSLLNRSVDILGENLLLEQSWKRDKDSRTIKEKAKINTAEFCNVGAALEEALNSVRSIRDTLEIAVEKRNHLITELASLESKDIEKLVERNKKAAKALQSAIDITKELTE